MSDELKLNATNSYDPDWQTVPCEICGEFMRLVGVQICYRCTQLKQAIEANPDLARKILDALGEMK